MSTTQHYRKASNNSVLRIQKNVSTKGIDDRYQIRATSTIYCTASILFCWGTENKFSSYLKVKKNPCFHILKLATFKNFITSTLDKDSFNKVKSRKKYLEQNEEIEQNRTGPKNFDICFCVIFGCMVISGMETGH